ncbi:MAG: hypothetical protein JXB88_11485 [Spirochaetales bacterium]|nr:hypothetical protein [Spirochaetales bacterium]
MKYQYIIFLLIIFIVMTSCKGPDNGGSSVTVIYVDAASSEGGDGESWETAFRYLQDAITYARHLYEEDDSAPEIRIAEGVYKPTDYDGEEPLLPWGDVPEDFRFIIYPEVKLYGGYPTGGGPRNSTTNLTVLSGDIDDNDTIDADGITLDYSDIAGTNSNNLICFFDDEIGHDTVIDGLVITASMYDGISVETDVDSPQLSPTFSNLVFKGNDAACMRIAAEETGTTAGPVIENITATGNGSITIIISAGGAGGGIVNITVTTGFFEMNADNAITIYSHTGGIVTCTIEDITCRRNGAGIATETAGIYLSSDGGDILATIINSEFIENSGLGATVFNSTAEFINCVFRGNNNPGDNGGAAAVVSVEGGSVTAFFINCEFTGNTAYQRGAICFLPFDELSELAIINTTITANHSTYHGGLYNGGSVPVIVASSIIWGNTSGDSYPNIYGEPVFSSSIIEGSGGSGSWDENFGTDLGGNKDEDPQFTLDPDPGDGDWTTFSDNNYGSLILSAGSPAIDAGNNTYLPIDTHDLDDDGNSTESLPVDLAGSPRVVNSTVDMGALERQ